MPSQSGFRRCAASAADPDKTPCKGIIQEHSGRPARCAGNRRSSRSLAEALADNPEARAVVIRAEGKGFSVGADIGGMGGGAEPPPTVQVRRTAEGGGRLMRAIREIHQPTICVIQGIATSGAACIATACDFRIGTPDARIGYGEVKLGINLMWHALPLATQTVGLARAKQMVMHGPAPPQLRGDRKARAFLDVQCLLAAIDA